MKALVKLLKSSTTMTNPGKVLEGLTFTVAAGMIKSLLMHLSHTQNEKLALAYTTCGLVFQPPMFQQFSCKHYYFSSEVGAHV